MTMRTTKINRETDALENQIQLDGDLDALNTSALHRQYITAAANALSLLFTDRSVSNSCHGETCRKMSKVPKRLRSPSPPMGCELFGQAS